MANSPPKNDISRKTERKFVVLLSTVSLFADMTYEGARSITGPYLAILGANAAVVGFVAGFGELVGYALRIVSGYLADALANTGQLLFSGISVIYLLFHYWHWQDIGGLPQP